MRVLHIYSGNLYGGIETMLVTLARCKDLCPEMEPHFALCFEGRLSKEMTAVSVPTHLLGQVRVSRPASVLRARRALADLLRKNSYDVAVCHSTWAQSIFGPVVRAAHLPLVFWLHDAVTGRHWLERWARRAKPDLTITNSSFTASTLTNLYPGTQAEVLCYPVAFVEPVADKSARLRTRAQLDTPADAKVIIQVSRMEAWKGHTLHLEALAGLRDLPGWICWLVGGAQRPQEVLYCEELKSIAAQLGISDRIRFVGESSDVPGLLDAADIFCQPNIAPEPFGIVFIEALYARLPVVATALGGAREIINDLCGLLVEPADAHALALALRELITNHAFRTALGAYGPTRARQLCDPAAQISALHSALMTVATPEMVG
jgi:glycosyltransferase involved in cell wall biosynthesis